MNCYDFDKTIFYPDSSGAFYGRCLKKHFLTMLPTLPKSIVYALRYKRGKLSAKELKQQLFSFLPKLADVDREVLEFWDENRQGIGQWYLEQKRSDDVIISASPEFLLAPICRELGVTLIGTRMDKHTGLISGNNCHDVEKVPRFYELFPGAHVDEFYSDSLTDSPMAELADRAFMLKKHKVSPWPEK